MNRETAVSYLVGELDLSYRNSPVELRTEDASKIRGILSAEGVDLGADGVIQVSPLFLANDLTVEGMRKARVVGFSLQGDFGSNVNRVLARITPQDATLSCLSTTAFVVIDNEGRSKTTPAKFDEMTRLSLVETLARTVLAVRPYNASLLATTKA